MKSSIELRPWRIAQPLARPATAGRSRCLHAAWLALLLTATTVADASVEQCHAVADREARLDCYDRVSARTAAPAPAQTEQPPAAEATPPAAAPARPRPTVPEPAPQTATVEPVPSAIGQRASERQPDDADEPLAGARIVRVSTTSVGRRQFMLDNGEVWEQIETQRSTLKEGDLVDLQPGLFNAWQMRESKGNSRSVRVRRAN